MTIWCVAVLGCAPLFAQEPAWPTPPGQPETGPGGSDYAYQSVISAAYGRGADRVWTFQPRGDVDGPLPVVVFVHGLNAVSHHNYGLWIRHLVRRGNIVIYPEYQETGLIDPRTFTDTSAKAVRVALDKLANGPFAKPDPERFALVGHSLGGTIVANLAARHEHYGLPRPRALMPVLPGDVKADTGVGAFLPSLMQDHGTIPRGTLMLVVAAEDDNFVGQSVARRIYRATQNISTQDKDYLLIGADDYGRPELTADHFLPLAYVDRSGLASADAYDFALWRWFDGLADAAFYDGKHRDYALGNTPQQRQVGRWSDNRPVREVLVTDDP